MTPINILGAFLLWAVLIAIGIAIAIFYNYAKEMIQLKKEEIAMQKAPIEPGFWEGGKRR